MSLLEILYIYACKSRTMKKVESLAWKSKLEQKLMNSSGHESVSVFGDIAFVKYLNTPKNVKMGFWDK
jgi:hypothetical protein